MPVGAPPLPLLPAHVVRAAEVSVLAFSPASFVLGALAAAALAAAATLALMTRGRMTLDLGWGRSRHRLGPISVLVAAPREVVFEQVAAPYLGRTPKALRGKLEVLDRDGRLVVAAHRTRLRWFTSVTVETVAFEEPARIAFRHLRGPVPEATEEFVLRETDGGTEIEYRGQLGIDFFFLGRLAGRLWAVPTWERVVRKAMEDIRRGAEERAAARRQRERG